MAAALIGGAAVGAAFEILFKAVIDATRRVSDFNSDLSRLRSTLESIKPTFDDIRKMNRILDRPQRETEMFTDQLKLGEKLVTKCSKVKWNVFKRLYYSKKLSKLEKLLLRFFQIDMAVLHYAESKKISVGVNGLEEKMNELAEMMKTSTINGANPKGFLGWSSVPGEPNFVVGLDQPLLELRRMLLEENEPVVVVSAPGGCGKTTLAKKICHDEQIKGMFGNNIYFVTVSRSPNLHLIVQKIFQTIDNRQVPDFQGYEDPVNQLEQLFSRCIGENPILLVLDDVWTGSLAAESLIEKFLFRRPKYKILVTSRSVLPSFSNYKLKVLSDQQAVELLCHWAFKDGLRTVSNDLVDQVVKSCGGFPIALKVVGRSLYGYPEATWISRFGKYSNGNSIFSMSSDVLNCLKDSLDALDEMPILKECFLDLGSFPEDQKVPVSSLLDMWVELYNLDEAGACTLAYLYELYTRNLVDLSLHRSEVLNGTDYRDEHSVTQHDLLRELAIYLSGKDSIEYRRKFFLEVNGNDFPKWWIEKNPQPIQARILSISTDETFVSNWGDLEVPNVEVFMLNFRTNVCSLPNCMGKMWHLKVLIMMNYGPFPAEIRNFPNPNHLLNLKRIRLERVSISSIAASLLQLVNLRKISLVMCENIDEALNRDTDTNTIWPNLVEIAIDYCDDLEELPLWFCKLTHLQKLSITHCPDLNTLPEEIGNLTDLEVLRLRSCTLLEELPKSIGRLHKLRFLDVSDCVDMECVPEEIGQLRSLKKLDMRGCRGLSELPISITDLVMLENVVCDEETACLWDVYKIGWSNLRISVVKEDKNLKWLHNFSA